MNSLKATPTIRPEVFRFTSQPRLESPSLIVGWMTDIGDVSRAVADLLARAAGGRSFCQIEPTDFFSVSGVSIESNIARFPQSRFYHDERDNILLLRSDEPQSHKYEFLNAVLDLAERYKVETLYTVDGIASMSAHTLARRVFGVFSNLTIQRRLRWYLPVGMNWQGTPHTSTYLLWLAKQRHLGAASIWVEVPFYLAGQRDAQAVKTAASLLGHIVGWDYDIDELNLRATEQDRTLAHLRREDPEIDARIQILEQGGSLDSEEQAELLGAIQGALRKHG